MLRFACSNCGVFLKAPDEKAGSTTMCPKCRNRTSVPEKHDIAMVDESEREVETTDDRAKSPRSWPPNRLLLCVGLASGVLVVSVLACITLIVGTWIAKKGDGSLQRQGADDTREVDPDQVKTKKLEQLLTGKWECVQGDFVQEITFDRLPGSYKSNVRSFTHGDLGSFYGKWFLRDVFITFTVDVSFDRNQPAGASLNYEIITMGQNVIELRDVNTGLSGVYRKRS